MNIKICAVVAARTHREIEFMVKKAVDAEADLIEIRMDYLENKCNVDEIRDLTTIPLIATNRPKGAEGFFKGSETSRIGLLYRAADAGFDFVDIELETDGLEEIVTKMEAKPIISFHDFSSTPHISKIEKVFEREREVGAEICKIITTANTVEDNLTCLQFVTEASRTNKVVCFCMGKLGTPSRLLSPLFGSSFTYASVERGKETALGQLTISDILTIYRMLEN